MDPIESALIPKRSLFSRRKVFWKEPSSHQWCFYCPLCRSPRKVPYRPTPGGARHVIQIALTALTFMCAAWPWLGWKGAISFVPMWIAFEIFYRGRVRMALSCPHCGFDPYLYLDDVGRARTEVENHWRKKFAEKGVPYPEKKVPPLKSPTAH